MMFNKSQVEAYSNIKAPTELYEKVANSNPGKSKIYLIPLVSSLAACIILIFGIASFGAFRNPQVIFNGQELSDTVTFYDVSPANVYDMRSSPVLSVPITLELKEQTEVSVSEGILVLENEDRTKYNIFNGTVNLVWEIERTGDFPEATMTLESSGRVKEITFTQNEADGSFTAKIN